MGAFRNPSTYNNKGPVGGPTNPTTGQGLAMARSNQAAVLELLSALPPEELSIRDGALLPTRAAVVADTEGGAPADDLAVISPQVSATDSLHPGMLLMLRSKDPSRKITVRHTMGVNGIRTWDGRDAALDPVWPLCLTLSENGDWLEIPGGRRAYDAIVPPDGVTIKTVDGKLEARTFTAPTADKAGTAGIVPGPPATPPSELLENVLAADAGWMGFSRNTLVQNKRTGGRELVPGVEWHSPGSVDINAVMSGRHWCREWKNAPGTDASGLMEAYQLFDPVNNKWGGIQTFVDNNGDHWWRGTRGDDAPVGSPIEYGEWIKTGAPLPRMAGGIGQWSLIVAIASTVTLPPGGAWAWMIDGWNGNGQLTSRQVGVSAGGTPIYAGSGAGITNGFAWRVL